MDQDVFRLGTRGSTLARRQAAVVQEALEAHRIEVEVVEVSTTGDRLSDELIRELGRTGAFVRNIDERVIAGELDGAVHSLKDMPTEMPEELIVAAIPERARANDVLVTPAGASLADLPPEAVIGTGSLRRGAQLGRIRADLDVAPIRGNVDTRLEKLLAPALQQERDEVRESDGLDEWLEARTDLERRALDRDVETSFDGLILARAGLERAELTDEAEVVDLPIEEFVPAPGQGAIALTMRDTDRAELVHRHLDHPPSRVAVTAERALLATLGGGCIAPIGVHAVVQGEIVRTRAQVLSTDGTDVVEATRELPVESHAQAAVTLGEELAAQGATELIAAAKRSADDGPDPP